MEDYPVTLFLSAEGYFKKILPASLRMNSEQKYKDGDELNLSFESSNNREILFLTDRQQMYKCRVADFEECKASVLGLYLPTLLEMDEGENILTMIDPADYSQDILFMFENGKAARVEMAAYETKTNRRKLLNAYCDKSPLVYVCLLDDEKDLVCYTSDGRALVFNTSLLAPKSSRSVQGVQAVNPKAKRFLKSCALLEDTPIVNVSRYRGKSLPAAGAILKSEDKGEQQLSLIEDLI